MPSATGRWVNALERALKDVGRLLAETEVEKERLQHALEVSEAENRRLRQEITGYVTASPQNEQQRCGKMFLSAASSLVFMRVRIQQIFEQLLLLLIENAEPDADAIGRMLLRASERAALTLRQCFLQAEDRREVACRPWIRAQRIILVVARWVSVSPPPAAQQLLVLERMLCRIRPRAPRSFR
jgi:hypothetical protein